jgi:hypothetical protein
MKTTLTKFLVGLALASLALAGSSGLFAGTAYVFSTFDTNINSAPYYTNYWVTAAAPSPYFTNGVGNPGGAMAIDMTFAQGTAQWQWQDYQPGVSPFGDAGDGVGINMGIWDYIEFDFACDTNASIPNTSYTNMPYGGVGVIGQGWPYQGDNVTNIPAGDPLTWHQFGSYIPAPATNGWFHVQLPVNGGFRGTNGNTLTHLILQCFEYPDTNGPTAARFLFDNIQFTALGKPPKMAYLKAIHGLNIFGTTGGNDRNGIETYQSSPPENYYMWAGSGPANYSFTITNWPTGAAQTAFLFRMDLLPSAGAEAALDWNETNCIMMELGADTNGWATWIFRWKTNAAMGNGQYYDAASQIYITNPTVFGKWTLSFANDQNVTMTTPSGNSTNFIMGSASCPIPDISPAFAVVAPGGVVYLGMFGGSSNTLDIPVVLAGAQISGLGVTGVSNNWMAETFLDPNDWVPVAGVSWYLVPTNNAMWLNWTLPDGGFGLQTNTVQPGAVASWSTNHGLATGTLFPTHRGLVVKPGDLPNTKNLFFRLNNNPTQ